MANTLNPFPQIGTQLTSGLTAIASTSTGITTVDDLVTAIYNYIQPIYYPGTTVPKALEIELKASVYNIINAYNNNPETASLYYGPKQSYFIDLMLGERTTNLTPLNAIDNWLADIEDNITKDSMGIASQSPLLLATETGRSVYAYWKGEVDSGASPWGPYFGSTMADRNYANIPFWTASCMEGTLIGAQATAQGMIAPTTEIVSTNIICALIGGLAIGAGKVIFKWVPRLQPMNVVTNNAGGCGCGK
jgi:hypothetical protein